MRTQAGATEQARKTIAVRRNKNLLIRVGLFLVVVPVVASIFAPCLSKHDPNHVDLTRRLRPPSAGHWYGTDEVGRDIFARELDGGRSSTGAGVGVVLPDGAVSTILGGLSGRFGGRFDLAM